MKIRLPESLVRRRLFWVFSGAFPLVAFAILMVVVFGQQQENSIKRVLHEAGESSALVVERAITHQIALLEGLSTSPDLDRSDFAAFLVNAKRLWALHPEWRTLILTDENKPILNLSFASGKPITPLRDPRSLRQVWESKKPFVGDLANGYVAIRVPVIRDNKIIFTLVAPTDPQFFKSVLQTSSRTKPWWYVIVGSNGVVISASSEIGIQAGKSFVNRADPNLAPAAIPTSLRGAPPVLISPSDWRIYVFAPSGSIEAPFTIRRIAVYLAGGVAAIASVFLMLVLGSAWSEKQEAIRLHKEIEDRKQAQKALQESEQRFRLLVENAPDAIFLEANGLFVYLNRTAFELFGTPTDGELIRKPVVESFDQDSRDSVEERMRPSNKTNKPASRILLKCLRKDGTPADVEVSTVPFEFGGEHGVLFFLRNVTELLQAQLRQRELEEQLHQAQKIESIGRLAGGVAHDYNNVLTVIIGYTEMALNEVESREPLHAYLTAVHASALRSANITRQLLAFARKQAINPVTLDLNDTIESMLGMIRQLIGEDIELAWHPRENLWSIKMDPSQIDQILANLCVNARDATNNVGKITIATDMVVFDEADCLLRMDIVPGEFVELTVSDNGRGMDKNTMGNIFEPFFTTKGVGQGTGLGLATVYGIVKQNDGFINIRSELGRGSTFKIHLPRHRG
jgi:PAS domain S-box-containing protein